MYTFTDRGGRSVTLRPENTAGVARAYVEHALAQAGRPWKLFYIGPQYRYERPQKGRYREFRQIGAEALGDPTAFMDAELLVMLFEFLGRLGFTGLSVSINSVGSDATRPAYVEAVKRFFSSNEGNLGEDDRRRLAENPLRVLDSKDPAVKSLVSSPSFPKMVDLLPMLDKPADAHHHELKALLLASKIPFKEDPLLVRGLDYYTRTVFEVTAEGLGAQNALLGGGRYDKLISDLGGPRTPGVGFAIGEDRLVEVLPESFRKQALESARAIAVVPVGSVDMPDAWEIAKAIRQAGIPVDFFSGHRSLGAALKAVERTGLSLAVLVGQNETSRGAVVVKNLAKHSQEELAREGLAAALRARL
jgi:histidyl-tRNA synthetase